MRFGLLWRHDDLRVLARNASYSAAFIASVISWEFNSAKAALTLRTERRATKAQDEITFPVPWNRPVGRFGRTLKIQLHDPIGPEHARSSWTGLRHRA